ncbi:MAG: 30S ribosomal protein S17 [Candidatus Omnitrophica bacterium]|nr:30S ribosomal protein S17 [Candidatus Omnitrophota bacterium]MBU1869200.1 30S ribosomal protein S17 [Candidatus Omnitrophota bacterium]
MGKRKEFIGTVISDKMQKTIIVKVARLSKHPKYGRVVKISNKYKAHNEKGEARIGDKVLIAETRPLSKDKRFALKKIIRKAQIPHVEIKEETK